MSVNSIKITAISQDKLLEVLRKSGVKSITKENIQADIAAGLPVNVDGTINVIEYIAWLVRSESYGN